MSLPSYIVNFPELEALIKELLNQQQEDEISGIQRVKGFYKTIPAFEGRYLVADIVFEDSVVITGVTYSQSAWKSEDTWDLEIAEKKYFENIYTKEMGESKHYEITHIIPPQQKIQIFLNNESGNSRDVWVDIEYINIDTTQKE